MQSLFQECNPGSVIEDFVQSGQLPCPTFVNVIKYEDDEGYERALKHYSNQTLAHLAGLRWSIKEKCHYGISSNLTYIIRELSNVYKPIYNKTLLTQTFFGGDMPHPTLVSQL
jgi:hypothetical protein